ncbi:MAG TPA: hypothetical protein VGO07_01895 [Candidatus Saccharimonadales bacterium]|nr:hypothetical protein [Candidatus Saccharimonadales bacterium]
MSELHESTSQLSPREVLEGFLGNEPLGSPSWLRVADYFALMHVETRINYLQDYPQSVELLQAVADRAQITETVRNRSVGIDAVAYNQVNVGEVYAGYFGAHAVPDPQRERNFLVQETHATIAEAVLADLRGIVTDRAVTN